ncbi:conserved hypothetical protein [Cellulomonas flavigena DSM 20109]|uniref:ATP synthase protein I n=1 Tax=Cellulomonas flavigena (strain ATCC 482 / DSM 20109 / BCRC 11376 / JCM 18109 / NBRC 3775 / NCIMB 8073 / NRS 134) TaxID=446466 RepID=D5ULC8_CELFN|nr:hypothetical protein [Cellulomonas flavigena]ADG73970.1 conserved hypothetical protein [Cellulomonas flavigena DSM 20109]
MTTDPTTPAPDPTAAVFRRALRDTALLLGTLAVLGIGVGALVAGLPGVWGALVGVGLALVFSGTTVVAMLRTLHSPPHTMAAVVMGTWLAKVLVVVVVLAVLRDQDFYSRGVLAAVLALGVVGSAFLDYRAVANGRVPYVEPGAGGR